MCYTAKSKKERTKQIASKDILVYKVTALVDDHVESLYRDYKYLPNIINKHIKLHYKYDIYTYRHRGLNCVFKGHIIDKGYYSYINKEIAKNDLSQYLIYACVKYAVSPKPLVCAECVIPKGTKYCVNKEGVVISETIIYTGRYIMLYNGR